MCDSAHLPKDLQSYNVQFSPESSSAIQLAILFVEVMQPYILSLEITCRSCDSQKRNIIKVTAGAL